MIRQTKQRMKRTSHHFTERQVRLLRMYATETGLSVAEILRRFTDDGLKKVGFDVNSEKAKEKSTAND